MIALWSGIANTWDCDEMGHMNVRVYVEKAMEGLGTLAGEIGMPHAFRANAPSTLIVAEHHIRYINEAHAGLPLSMTGCVLDWDETSALIYQDMRHGDGRPAAAFRTRVRHVEAKTGKPFAWSTRSQAQLESLRDEPPEATRPRGLDPEAAPVPPSEATLERARAFGTSEIGRGLFQPHECDIFGRVAAPRFIGRISDSVPNLLHDWRTKIGQAGGGARMGAAVLEYRLVYRKWPRAGDRYVIHSGLSEVREKTHNLCHWVLDPDTGDAWCTTEAVAVTFDLDTRKALATPKEQKLELERLAPRGLRL